MEWEREALPPNHHSGQLFPDGSDCFNFLVEEFSEPESSLFHVGFCKKTSTDIDFHASIQSHEASKPKKAGDSSLRASQVPIRSPVLWSPSVERFPRRSVNGKPTTGVLRGRAWGNTGQQAWWNDVFHWPLLWEAAQPSQSRILWPTCPKVMLISDRDGEVSLWALLVLQLFKCFAYHTIIAPSSDYWHHQHQLLMGSELFWVHGIEQDAKRYQMQAQKGGERGQKLDQTRYRSEKQDINRPESIGVN